MNRLSRGGDGGRVRAGSMFGGMGMATKNKPYTFTALAKCATLCGEIQNEYESLPRCSLMCHDLWAESSRVFAIIKYVENKIRLSFSLRLPQGYPSDFIATRKKEASKCLVPLRPVLAEALKFLRAFNHVRRGALKKKFGESVKVQKKMSRYERNYHKTLENLIKEAKKYKEFILSVLDTEECAQFDIYFSESFNKREAISEQAKTGAKQIAGDLENHLRNKKNPDYKRIAVLVKALEDSNGLLNKPGVDSLILDAKQVLKNQVDKPGGLFKMFTKKFDAIPGVQDLGPLGIEPIPTRFNSRFDVRDLDKTKSYLLDLGDYILPDTPGCPANFKYEAKVSPLSTITGKRSYMLDSDKVPERARCYCFAYPIEGVDPKTVCQPVYENKPDSATFSNFILFGGFMYFDENNDFLQVSALDPEGNDIQFSGPFLIEGQDLKVLKRLRKKEEWAPVTVPDLRRQGADRFAWLKPGELGNGYGSFVFSINEDKQRFTFFDIVEMSPLPEAALVKEAEEDTLFYNDVSKRFRSTKKI